MNSKYSSAALEKASDIFLSYEEVFEYLEISLVTRKGFSAVKINLIFMKPQHCFVECIFCCSHRST